MVKDDTHVAHAIVTHLCMKKRARLQIPGAHFHKSKTTRTPHVTSQHTYVKHPSSMIDTGGPFARVEDHASTSHVLSPRTYVKQTGWTKHTKGPFLQVDDHAQVAHAIVTHLCTKTTQVRVGPNMIRCPNFVLSSLELSAHAFQGL